VKLEAATGFWWSEAGEIQLNHVPSFKILVVINKTYNPIWHKWLSGRFLIYPGSSNLWQVNLKVWYMYYRHLGSVDFLGSTILISAQPLDPRQLIYKKMVVSPNFNWHLFATFCNKICLVELPEKSRTRNGLYLYSLVKILESFITQQYNIPIIVATPPFPSTETDLLQPLGLKIDGTCKMFKHPASVVARAQHLLSLSARCISWDALNATIAKTHLFLY
jgi:hypothetical protein